MGLLINLSLLICTYLPSVESRGLLAPQKILEKKAAASFKNATVAKVTDDEEDEMMPPMEAYESVDSDVDVDADKKEMEAEEEARHSHHSGGDFGVHKVGEKNSVNPRNKGDPMTAVHSHRLGEAPAKTRKAAPAPVAVKKPAAAAKVSHLSSLKDLVGVGEEEDTPKPIAKPEQKKSVEAAKSENQTEVPVSPETIAEVEKMKAMRAKEKAAAKAPQKVAAPNQTTPKKPHNLGKDLAAVSAADMAPLDDKVVAKLKEAMPSTKKVHVPVTAVHGHEHGDAIGRLHADAKAVKEAQEAEERPVTHTPTVAKAAPRRASPQQLAAARRASALTDALRNVNASDVQVNLDVSEEAAKKIRDIESKKKAETDRVEEALKAEASTKDHMEDLRATAEKALEAKVHHLEAKNAKKVVAKAEHSIKISKLAEALGVDDQEATTSTTAAPAKAAAHNSVDAINALHQRIEKEEHPTKQAEKPKPKPAPVQQTQTEEPENGIIAGFHHNKADDHLAPVLR